MTAGAEAALAAIFFVTSLVTVVTGSTTLITVPVMLLFGIAPRTAVATNMLALAMLSVGGMLPFVGTSAIDRRRAPLMVSLTLAGSIIGALLLFAVPVKWMTLAIPCAMIAVLTLFLFEPRGDAVKNAAKDIAPSPARNRAGYAAMTLLAVYGGFLSGGYATLITAAGVLFFRYPLLSGIAMSRALNAASSLVAVAVFARYGIIDWRLGILLSLAAFPGGMLGSHIARRLPARVLRPVFLVTVAALALKSLIFDVPWRGLLPAAIFGG